MTLKIKNNTVSNLSIPSMKTRGQANKSYMIVPGEATLELDDNVWKEEFADNAVRVLEAGNLEIVEAPALTEEEIAAAEEAELVRAKALLAKSEAKSKAKAPAAKAEPK